MILGADARKTVLDSNQSVARHFNNGNHMHSVCDIKIRDVLRPTSGNNDSRMQNT
jgi:hypothetical protein